VIAILGGLGAALMWATSTLCSARSSRMIGTASALAWVMLTGLAANLVLFALDARIVPLNGSDVAGLLIAGVGDVLGLLLAYSALRRGKIGLVAPIISTDGALTALLAIATGELLGIASTSLLVVVVVGVVLAAMAPEEPPSGQSSRTAAGLATLAAISFGVSVFVTGELGRSLPIAWAMLPPRVVGVVAVTIPLALSRRLRIEPAAAPLVVTAGLAEVLGFACYVIGARHSIAVAAILSSQFAAVASLAAYVLFRERLTWLQLGGGVLIVFGVTALMAIKVN
jgi:drug/metabolite transporter (DMT)-like permease